MSKVQVGKKHTDIEFGAPEEGEFWIDDAWPGIGLDQTAGKEVAMKKARAIGEIRVSTESGDGFDVGRVCEQRCCCLSETRLNSVEIKAVVGL